MLEDACQWISWAETLGGYHSNLVLTVIILVRQQSLRYSIFIITHIKVLICYKFYYNELSVQLDVSFINAMLNTILWDNV